MDVVAQAIKKARSPVVKFLLLSPLLSAPTPPLVVVEAVVVGAPNNLDE